MRGRTSKRKGVGRVGGGGGGREGRGEANCGIVMATQDCLQAKDNLNYRYFHKRALYLSIVAGHLQKKRKTCELQTVEFSFASGNPLLPILVLTPKGTGMEILKFIIGYSLVPRRLGTRL